MKGRAKNILMAIALVAMVVTSCNRGPRIIPRSTMVKIYCDMLLEDQWLMSNRDVYFSSDTTLVYEPVFEKYGYDTEDYRESVKYYLQDPDRFARILKKSANYLGTKQMELDKEINNEINREASREENSSYQRQPHRK